MRRFSSPAKQSREITNKLRKHRIIPSIRSGENYKDALKTIATKSEEWGLPRLREYQPEHCVDYLKLRADEVSQSTLNMERLALQYTLQFLGKLSKDGSERIPTIKSNKRMVKKAGDKIYTRDQVDLIKSRVSTHYQLLIELAATCGLSPVDFFTIRPLNEQPESYHPENEYKHFGQQGRHYSVKGKYGITREVIIPDDLAEQLEALRLETSKKVTDRKVSYTVHYQLSAGSKLSSAFTQASIRALGWSHGISALRSTYTYQRIKELQHHGASFMVAKKAVGYELGNVAPRSRYHRERRKNSRLKAEESATK